MGGSCEIPDGMEVIPPEIRLGIDGVAVVEVYATVGERMLLCNQVALTPNALVDGTVDGSSILFEAIKPAAGEVSISCFGSEQVIPFVVLPVPQTHVEDVVLWLRPDGLELDGNKVSIWNNAATQNHAFAAMTNVPTVVDKSVFFESQTFLDFDSPIALEKFTLLIYGRSLNSDPQPIPVLYRKGLQDFNTAAGFYNTNQMYLDQKDANRTFTALANSGSTLADKALYATWNGNQLRSLEAGFQVGMIPPESVEFGQIGSDLVSSGFYVTELILVDGVMDPTELAVSMNHLEDSFGN